MHILIISDSYPPEIRSASHLMYECAQELQRRGHRVSVMTCWPRYNLEKSAENIDVKEFAIEEGVEVVRVKTLRHHKVNYIYRGIAELLMPVLFKRKAKKYGLMQPDVVLVYSPPLALTLLGADYARRGIKFILNVQDIFPQNAIDLGVLNNTMAISFYRAIERAVYRSASIITTHSVGNQYFLQNAFPDYRHKIVDLPNWIDLVHYQAKGASNFRERYGIATDKRVVLFAGVLGPSQNLDWLLELATNLENENLLFLIVGDGSDKLRLQQKASDLSNVMFQDFVGRGDYPDLLAASDLGIVSLSEKNKTPVVPGKLLGYMAAKMPVFAILNRESDAHGLIEEAKCGVSVAADQSALIAEKFTELLHKEMQWDEMGMAGYEYASSHFSKEKSVSLLEQLMECSNES